MNTGYLTTVSRRIIEQVNLTLEKWEKKEFLRIFADGVTVDSSVMKKQSFIRKMEDVLSGSDNQGITILFYRNITDTSAVLLANHWTRVFYRKVTDTIDNIDSMESGAGFYRYQTDTVYAESSLLRKAGFFVRIAAQLIVDELVLGRFLKAKSEITLKSCVMREITLESRIA